MKEAAREIVHELGNNPVAKSGRRRIKRGGGPDIDDLTLPIAFKKSRHPEQPMGRLSSP